jgi:hypothetical protein
MTLAFLGSLGLAPLAGAVTLDASSWINADDPIKENQSATSETGDGFINIIGNGDLAVVSDFSVGSSFDFSGNVYAPADDDIMGWVFGYQDGFNNYRVSWTGGEDHDWEAGRRFGGLMLVRETGGMTDVLFRNASLLWTAGIAYEFTLTVRDSAIGFLLREGGSLISESWAEGDFTGISGSVGVFTRSNGANFYDLNDEPLSAVPVPPALPLLLAGAAALAWVGRRKKA